MEDLFYKTIYLKLNMITKAGNASKKMITLKLFDLFATTYNNKIFNLLNIVNLAL